MRKRRILIANDASNLGTGYGVYGKELLTRLHATGKYEIAELACYVSTDNVAPLAESVPWKIYPNAPSNKDPENLTKQYHSNIYNAFGAWRFDPVCLHFKPDIVFDVRDYWMYSYQETSPSRPYYKWVVMPTVDSAPQKEEWLHTFTNMDLVVPYTEWASHTLSKQCGDKINMFPRHVNAGVDLNSFVPPENKKELQRSLFGRDVEITGCVMRNQKRKLIPNVLKAYRAYLDRLEIEDPERYEKSFLYMHTSYPEVNGWNLPQLLMEHRMLDKTYFTNVCINCKSVSINKFHPHSALCGHCAKFGLNMPNAGHGVATDQLNTIYQLFDLFLQVAICEGFGMPQIEAAACGVPIASTDYSAMSEIVRNLEGYPIPVAALFREMETEADRAIPDNEAITNIIYDHFALSEEEKQTKSKRSRELCEKYYSWDSVASVWDIALSSVDISDLPKWDDPIRPVDTSAPVPSNSSPRGIVEHIVKYVIKEPWLLKTFAIQKVIKDLSVGWQSSKAGAQKEVSVEAVVQHLEILLKRKVSFEQIRLNPEKVFDQEFLHV